MSVNQTVSQSINQTINQSITSQSIFYGINLNLSPVNQFLWNKSRNQSLSKSLNLSQRIDQPVYLFLRNKSHSIIISVSQSISKSVNQSINHQSISFHGINLNLSPVNKSQSITASPLYIFCIKGHIPTLMDSSIEPSSMRR